MIPGQKDDLLQCHAQGAAGGQRRRTGSSSHLASPSDYSQYIIIVSTA